MLKLGDPTRYEKMIPVDTSLLMKEAKEIEDNACGDYCVVRAKDGSKLVKILEFSHFFKHIVFMKDDEGYLQKKVLRAVPVSVYYYMG